MKILNIVGARPQFIKAAVIERTVKERNDVLSKIVHTGQHYDKNMSDIFFEELDIPKPEYHLGVGSGSHGKQTGFMLAKLEEVFIKEKPDWVLVYGDTNSTIAAALAATKLHIKVAHVEAGLRSYNMRMPEEINRIATDRISDILFAPTQNALDILNKEGLGSNSFFTGDVMFDSVLHFKQVTDTMDFSYLKLPEKFYLATVHRPSNTDNETNLRSIFSAFEQIEYPVLVPLHPRTKSKIENIELQNTKVIEPVSYLEMIHLLKHSEAVLTDSGGLQKEAYFLNKKCVTMREETEWIETLENDWNHLVGTDKNKILASINSKPKTDYISDSFGDGRSAELILDLLENKK